jgi:hypothetical protein
VCVKHREREGGGETTVKEYRIERKSKKKDCEEEKEKNRV